MPPESVSTTSPTTEDPVVTSSTTPPVEVPEDQEAPEVLPTTVLSAVDDSFVASSEFSRVDVLSNDTGDSGLRLVSVGQPTVGSVAIAEDGLIEVTFPDSFAGSIEFEYVVTDDSGAVRSALVIVESSNILGAASEFLTGPEETSVTVGALGSRVQTIYGDLIELRLSTFQLTALSLAPMLLGLLYWAVRERDHLVSVTSVVSGDVVLGSLRSDGSVFPLRHDALVWTRNRTRKRNGRSETLVRLGDGQQVWVPSAKIADTGY